MKPSSFLRLSALLLGLVCAVFLVFSNSALKASEPVLHRGHSFETHFIDELSEEQVANLQVGDVYASNLQCGAILHFVYAPQLMATKPSPTPNIATSKSSETLVTTPSTSRPQTLATKSYVGKPLPKTGETGSGNRWLWFVLPIVFTLAVFCYRSKKGKALFSLALMMLVATAYQGFSILQAQGELPDGHLQFKVLIPELEGYDYVGYYLEDGPCEKIEVTCDDTDFPQNSGTTSSTISDTIVPTAIPDDPPPTSSETVVPTAIVDNDPDGTTGETIVPTVI